MENLLKKAKDANSQLEIFKTTTSSTSVDVLNGKVESIDNVTQSGIAFRVLKDHKLGFGYTTDFDDEVLEDILEKAIESAKYTEADTFYSFPSKTTFEPLKTYDREISELSIEDKINLALKTEEFAYKQDKRVKKTEKVSFSNAETKIEILNSNGLEAAYHSNYYGISCDVIAEEKQEQESGSSLRFLTHIDKDIAEFVGKDAADKACELLGAKGIEAQNMPIVLPPVIGAHLLASITSLFSSDVVQKGKSLLAKKLNQTVGSTALTIIDNGRLKDGLMSAPFDDEGISTQETVLIEKGKLINFLYNSYTAAKEGKKSTGNARRASYKAVPDVAPSNLYIKPTSSEPKGIIDKITKGLYITRVMGMHTINPISGDFSIGAAGIMIENGFKTYPVRGITIAGNLIEFLESIEDIGNDLQFFPFSGNLGSPTLLIGNIAVSG